MTDSMHDGEKVVEHFRVDGPPSPDIVRLLQQTVVALTRVDGTPPCGDMMAVQLRDLTRYRVPIGEPGITPGAPANDPAIAGSAGGMLPAVARRYASDDLLLEHVAFVVRLADHYRASRPRCRPPKGGLAPWQLRRAEEIIEAHLDGEVPLARVAAQCGLSVGYFARAFARSTGKPPHRWLMARRVERAKELLLGSALSIAEIALGCGFADQAHFTRVFAAAVGTAPGRWRRFNRT